MEILLPQYKRQQYTVQRKIWNHLLTVPTVLLVLTKQLDSKSLWCGIWVCGCLSVYVCIYVCNRIIYYRIYGHSVALI